MDNHNLFDSPPDNPLDESGTARRDQSRSGFRNQAVLAFGREVQRVRSARKLTQRELADMSGLSVPTISNVENGRNESSHTICYLICESLGLDYGETITHSLRKARLQEQDTPL